MIIRLLKMWFAATDLELDLTNVYEGVSFIARLGRLKVAKIEVGSQIPFSNSPYLHSKRLDTRP